MWFLFLGGWVRGVGGGYRGSCVRWGVYVVEKVGGVVSFKSGFGVSWLGDSESFG